MPVSNLYFRFFMSDQFIRYIVPKDFINLRVP